MSSVASATMGPEVIEGGGGGPTLDPNDLEQLLTFGSVQDLASFAGRHPDRIDEIENELLDGRRIGDLSEFGERLRGGRDGVANVYIGGGFDQGHPVDAWREGPVEGYEAGLADTGTEASHYFNWGQRDRAVDYVEAMQDAGYTVNLIGHSYGATTAVKVAGEVDGPIGTLAGVDPVPHPGPDGDPVLLEPALANVDTVVLLNDVSNSGPDRNGSDRIENLGHTAGGGRAGVYHDPDLYIQTDFGHGSFASMVQHRPEGDGGRSVAELTGTPR